MNSRWQASRIGFVNFWYYDQQEFSFVNGRMLLRGANGSGKTVTMQSVIPLLLDGNMSPERLDPFGSRDRKMSSYLLEEGDDREERTGYLYLEFKREESDIWLTIGMGLRARRGKPLDKWYFSITDGRRVGKEFFLYKETDERVPLSKRELENSIADGGSVFDRQSDYMEYVNRRIFGFETTEEYKEMIDLLIQLRTPKLSKDFKPSVVNDILSDALQPLSDDDLRPMSEAIENMDTQNMNLKAREAGLQAAAKICRVLDRYNRLILFEKADRLSENEEKLALTDERIKEDEKTVEENIARIRELERYRSELDDRKNAMEAERESLNKSDAVNLKTREMDLAARIKDRKELIAEKEEQLSEKNRQYLESAGRKKNEQEKKLEKEREINSLLDEMQAEADDMSWEEHAFFADEFKRTIASSFSWEAHEKQLEKTGEEIVAGVKILSEVEEKKREVDDVLKEREKHQRETDAARRRERECEEALFNAANQWKEAVYRWNDENSQLKFTQEQLRQLTGFADEYGEDSDFAVVRHEVSQRWTTQTARINADIQQSQAELRVLEEEHAEIMAELEAWENHREPEPPRSDATVNNRKKLDEKGIPYNEFYKVVEFGNGMSDEECGLLEETLLEMGILDALVVDERYREDVMKSDPECADRYLFVREGNEKNSLLDVLEVNDDVNDIFMNPVITGILGNISHGDEYRNDCGSAITAIYADGSYQMGVVSGTVTGKHEAEFIGVMARERARQTRITSCHEMLAENEKACEALKNTIVVLKERIEKFKEEYEAFPDDGAMREEWRKLSVAIRSVELMMEEDSRIEKRLMDVSSRLKSLRHQAVEIAGHLYLTCSYDVFAEAEKAFHGYQRHLTQLRSGHEIYLSICTYLEELVERMDALDDDMDQIRYDMGRAERELGKEQEEYDSVCRQLELTDYEQIRKRLDSCMEWLREYPDRLRECVEEKAQRQEHVKTIEGQIADSRRNMEKYSILGEYLDGCFHAEAALGYVSIPEGKMTEAKAVRDALKDDCGQVDRDKIINDLNQVYYENKSFLNEYHTVFTKRFSEFDKDIPNDFPAAERLDIEARYRGEKIPFVDLPARLSEDIDNLRELIKEDDRRLFEDILANTVGRKIRGRINGSNAWVAKMNSLMSEMNTSSGLQLRLRWRNRTAETEEQLDTKELVELLKKDYRFMREDEAEKLSAHFRSKVEEARRNAEDSGGMISFYQIMKETLDYRKWFEFQLMFRKGGENERELTNSVFGTFSGGEKAMAMYVPLFSAVVARYESGRADAPRLISLDEAFAGVDNRNIRDMFRLMAELRFNFIINSQVLWGDCDTLDALAIYQLLRPGNAKFVTVMPYLWNGHTRKMLDDVADIEGELVSKDMAEGNMN